MRVLAMMATAAAVLAASSVQAAPAYRPDVVRIFKRICLPGAIGGMSVSAYAQTSGWVAAPATTKVWWHGAATKVWLLPSSPRLYLAEAPEGGLCEVGYFGGAQASAPDPVAFAAMMKDAMTQGGAALGPDFVKVSEPQGLLSQQGVYKSPSHPSIKVYVVVANIPGAPTFNVVSAKP